jgi:hypothetical protein
MVLLARGSKNIIPGLFSGKQRSHARRSGRSCMASSALRAFRKVLKKSPCGFRGLQVFKWKLSENDYNHQLKFNSDNISGIDFTEIQGIFDEMKSLEYWTPFEKKGCWESKATLLDIC